MKPLPHPLLLALAAALILTQPFRALRADDAALPAALDQLRSSSDVSGDATLKSVGGDLAAKTEALNKSLADNPAASSQLSGLIQSLASNKGTESIASLQKLTEAKLTPDQVKLAKEVGNLGSAYLVQRNLGSLEGSQGDVAQIVNSLRKGKLTESLPAIQKVAHNAKLTGPQKDLLGALADRYAPGTKKVGDALSNGLKSVPGFGK